jgi:hypothetical protein
MHACTNSDSYISRTAKLGYHYSSLRLVLGAERPSESVDKVATEYRDRRNPKSSTMIFPRVAIFKNALRIVVLIRFDSS